MRLAKKNLLITALSTALFANIACTTTDNSNTKVATTSGIMGATGERGIPYNYEKFQPILALSKLQISEANAKPGSKGEMATDGNWDDVVNPHFYVDKGSEALVFNMEGYKLRTELRLLKNFKSDEADQFNRLSATFMPINPRESVKNSEPKRDEMTFLQVHNKGTFDDGKHGVGYIPHPLLRVVYDANRNGLQDHYWAVIKNNAINCGSKSGNKGTPKCEGSYLRLDLGPIKTDAPSEFDIIVGDSKLVIRVDGETKVNHDISYWKEMLSYFKVGVYNQFKNGSSEAHFYELTHAIDSDLIN